METYLGFHQVSFSTTNSLARTSSFSLDESVRARDLNYKMRLELLVDNKLLLNLLLHELHWKPLVGLLKF